MKIDYSKAILLVVIHLIVVLFIWGIVGMEKIYRNFDGIYYVVVSKTWYDFDSIRNNFEFTLPLEYYPAHLPFYPATIWAISKLGLNSLQSMVVSTFIGSILLTLSTYYIFVKLNVNKPFFLALLSMIFWPRMLSLRVIGSPESWFILFILWSLFLYNSKRFFLSSLFGSLALLTKSPGILLFVSYIVYELINFLKTRRIDNFLGKMWTILIPITGVALFLFYQVRTGDFWAYFNTGDNIHLSYLPFNIFFSMQSWVGTFWLEDVIFLYLIIIIGTIRLVKVNHLFAVFTAVFFTAVIFVGHRDVSRYSLPIAIPVLIGLSKMTSKKEVVAVSLFLLVPILMYTINFISNNLVSISDWSAVL